MKKNLTHGVTSLILFTFLLLLPGCVHRKQIDKQKLLIAIPMTKNISITVTEHTPPPITIWVHGTVMFRRPSYHRIFKHTSCLMPIASLPKNHYFSLLAQTMSEHDSEHFPLEEFYVFGWSGRLQNQEREKAAEALYHEIIALQKEYYNKYGCMPIIRIITHSHGGNLVLNMARIQSTDTPFVIKSLVLLACPVQEKTMHLINNHMFQRVYSLYSSIDMVQILAPQFRRMRSSDEPNIKKTIRYKFPPFSARLFPTYGHLTQTKIKINNYPISHTYFAKEKFIMLLPTILQKLDSWHNESIINNKNDKYKLLCIFKK